jgi:hypothetical protein
MRAEHAAHPAYYGVLLHHVSHTKNEMKHDVSPLTVPSPEPLPIILLLFSLQTKNFKKPLCKVLTKTISWYIIIIKRHRYISSPGGNYEKTKDKKSLLAA